MSFACAEQLQSQPSICAAYCVTEAGVWMKWACSRLTCGPRSTASTAAWANLRTRFRVLSRARSARKAFHAALNPGDRLLLCSDGLSGMVTDEELLHISKHQPDPVKANQLMIEAAKNAGGNDNITAILIQMNGG